MDHKFDINPGAILIVPNSRVVGGRSARREKIREDPEGNALETEARVTVRIEDVPERERAEEIVQRATHAVRKAATHTLLGYLIDRVRLADVRGVIGALQAEASIFNADARTCRVEVGIVTCEIAVSLGSEAARAITDHVREELTALRDSLRAGDAKQVRAILLPTRAGNLGQLAIGPGADAIRFALEEGRDRLSDLRSALKDNGSGMVPTPETAGKALDLTMIDAAIATFTPADPAGQAMPGIADADAPA